MSVEKMLAEKQDGMGRMIFNNPERHNAVSLDMWDTAENILDDFAKDESIRVVVLAGSGGKAFVSGADISKFDDERGSKDAILKFYSYYSRFRDWTLLIFQGDNRRGR